MAAPIIEMTEVPTSRYLRAWNTSDVEEKSGETTACTSASELGTQVWACVLWRDVPMYDSFGSLESTVSSQCLSGGEGGARNYTYDSGWALKRECLNKIH